MDPGTTFHDSQQCTWEQWSLYSNLLSAESDFPNFFASPKGSPQWLPIFNLTETDCFVILLSAWFLTQRINLCQSYGILLRIVKCPKRSLKNQNKHNILAPCIAWHLMTLTRKTIHSTRCSSAAALAEMAASLGTTFRTTTHPPATALVRQGRNDWIWPKIRVFICGEEKSRLSKLL